MLYAFSNFDTFWKSNFMAGLTAEQLFIKQINLFILKYAAFTLNFPLKDLYCSYNFPNNVGKVDWVWM